MHTQVAIVREEIHEATEIAELVIGTKQMQTLMRPHWKAFDDIRATYYVCVSRLTRVCEHLFSERKECRIRRVR